MRIRDLNQLKDGDRIKVKGNMNVWVEGYARIEPNAHGKLTGIFFYEKGADEQLDPMVYIPKNEIGTNYFIETIEEPRGLRQLKVGDIVIDNHGDKRKILETLTNMFAYSDWENKSDFEDWETFERAEETGWKLETLQSDVNSKDSVVIYEDRDGEKTYLDDEVENLDEGKLRMIKPSQYPGHGTWIGNEVEDEDELTGDDLESLKTIINHMPIDGLPSDYRGASISYLDMKLNNLLEKRK